MNDRGEGGCRRRRVTGGADDRIPYTSLKKSLIGLENLQHFECRDGAFDSCTPSIYMVDWKGGLNKHNEYVHMLKDN